MASFEFLGPYRLGRVIGRGGMGTVYEAVHEASGDRVAVKLISATFAEDTRFRRRFAAEVETLKRLRHPGIVQLIGYGEEEGHLFYSMELVEGESLQQRIRRHKRIGWLPSVDIAIQVCAALKHAHDFGVIHRDLKPANLLLTSDETVKLVDFGIAKIFGYDEQTVVGSVLGTADYMAPEQAGSGPITPRTDLYALGSVMYAMLAGRPPFSGKRLTEVIESLKRDRPVPLDLISPDLPPEIVEVVHQLLEKKPEDRPPTALAVLNRLKATRAGLQRGKTLEIDSSHTVLDDGNGLDESATIDRPSKDDSDVKTGLSGNDNTDAGGAQTHASAVRSSVSNDAATEIPERSDSAVTRVSRSTKANVNESSEEQRKPPQRTHFQAVGDATPGGPTASTRGKPSLGHIASVAGLLLVLVAGLAVIAYAVRSPSPDELFRTIEVAQRDGDFLAAEPAIRRFLSDYPDDERADEVAELERSLNLDRSLQRLQARANRSGGLEQLDPMEQSFLRAMEQRGQRPVEARRMLAAWLAVYAPPGSDLVAADRRMVELAERELQRLVRRNRSAQNSERLQELSRRMMWAEENLDVPSRRRLLNGIIELFGEQSWANDAVAAARRQLEELDNPAATDSAVPSDA